MLNVAILYYSVKTAEQLVLACHFRVKKMTTFVTLVFVNLRSNTDKVVDRKEMHMPPENVSRDKEKCQHAK